ncbi:glycosyltransferase family 4 protein [candidate division WWE3 bacterium]|nr:glycosyltransferase family 4 protein [candidate division WWE3 bacterium]
MRILYVDHAPYEGGAEVSLKHLIVHLDKKKYQAIIAAPKGAVYSEPLITHNVPYIPISFHWLHYHLLYPIVLDVINLLIIIRKVRPNIVHLNTRVTNVLGGILIQLRPFLPFLQSIRFIHHVRDKDPLPQWKFNLIGKADWLIANSSQVKEFLVEGGIDESKISVIYNGVDLSIFNPVRFPCTEESFPKITFIGQLYPRKGVLYLLEAMKRIVQVFPNVRLELAGQDPTPHQSNLRQYKQLASQLGIEQSITWLGYRDDIARVLSCTDVFVLPSLEEPFGRVLIEAMALKIPVVATRVGGIPEIVVDQQTGLLVPPSNSTALADAIITLLANDSVRESMGQSGYNRVCLHFDLARHVESVQNLYNQL